MYPVLTGHDLFMKWCVQILLEEEITQSTGHGEGTIDAIEINPSATLHDPFELVLSIRFVIKR